MFVQNKFNLDKLYRDFPDFETRLGGNGRERRLTSSIFNVLPEIFQIKKQKNIIWQFTVEKIISEHINMSLKNILRNIQICINGRFLFQQQMVLRVQ